MSSPCTGSKKSKAASLSPRTTKRRSKPPWRAILKSDERRTGGRTKTRRSDSDASRRGRRGGTLSQGALSPLGHLRRSGGELWRQVESRSVSQSTEESLRIHAGAQAQDPSGRG